MSHSRALSGPGPTLSGLAALVATEPTLAGAIADARAGSIDALDLTAPAALRPFVVAGLVTDAACGGAGRPVLAVTATGREADELTTALQSLLDPDAVVSYPAWETLPHERLSPRSDTVGKRLAVLRRLVHPDEPGMPPGPIQVVVAPVRSVLQPQVRGLADLLPVSLQVGDEVELEDVVRRLVAAAYHRVDLVERRGEFAVRGGIVDVFSPTAEHPLRVEFFGDA
ncbi:MAG: transcription-repair coupling factor, partial [Actinomycetota bacterium]|nr:transcription-repair coupling factor [Actinomycetota bacterium]